MPAKTKMTKARSTEHPLIGDSLQNLLTGMGTERDARAFTTIQRSSSLSVSELDTSFTEGDLEHNIVAVPANDMTREWIDLQSDDDRSAHRIEKELDRLGARKVMREAITWARLTGGALVVLGLAKQITKRLGDGTPTNEPDLSLPAQPGHIEWLQVFDRFEVGDVDLDDAGNISHYHVMISRADAVVERIHASRCLRFDTEPLPRRMRNDAAWGCSVLDRCKGPIHNLDTAMNGVAVAVSRFSETVMKLDKFTELLAADKGGVAKKKLQMLNQMRSVFGMITLDKNDDMVEVSRQFSGVGEMLDRLIERVASAARMPVSKLMGRAAAGLNATGEGDIRNWYDVVAAMQELELRPVLTRLVNRIAESLGINLSVEDDGGESDGVTITINFVSLWKPTQKELAETHLVQAQADAVYLGAGVVSPEAITAARFSPTGYSVETVVELDDAETDPADINPGDLDPNNLDEDGNPTAPTTDLQKTALNGTQVGAAQNIVLLVATRQLPRSTGLGMLRVFYNLSLPEAETVMGPVGATFFASATPASATPAVPPPEE